MLATTTSKCRNQNKKEAFFLGIALCSIRYVRFGLDFSVLSCSKEVLHFTIPVKLVCFTTINLNSANQIGEFTDGRNFDWFLAALL